LEVEAEDHSLASIYQVKKQAINLKTNTLSKTVETTHEIAKKPSYIKQQINTVMENYNIPGLVHALKIFLIKFSQSDLHQSATASSQLDQYARKYNLPDTWKILSIWNRCTITLPVIGFENTALPECRAILSCLFTPKDSIPQFQTILVDENPDDPNPQDGIRGK
jgi:hypothetical protein